MRKQIISAFLLVGVMVCQAQTNVFPIDGYVGVGTTNPMQLFNVHGSWGNPATSGTQQNGIAAFSVKETYSTIYLGSFSTSPYGTWIQASGRHGLGSNLSLSLNPNGGNVGIGVVAPGEKLTVNGKIRAHEIKVESGPWPDYVFKPQYKLMPLSQVEDFIKEKGHLPEVPSAKEVAKDGIELGANQALLLKKIEEMTLHLININKRVESLEAENQLLKKQLKKASLE